MHLGGWISPESAVRFIAAARRSGGEVGGPRWNLPTSLFVCFVKLACSIQPSKGSMSVFHRLPFDSKYVLDTPSNQTAELLLQRFLLIKMLL
jgi:hypothetical protein